MIFNCPGSQKFKHPQPETLRCDSCGAEVEIWTDEAETRCQKCKKRVIRKTGQLCLDWCKYARECAGDEIYNKHMKNKSKK